MAQTPRHDKDRDGVLWADAKTELASLADQVRELMQRNPATPPAVAAAQVVAKLRELGNTLALFETDPAHFAKPLSLLKCVHKGTADQPARLAAVGFVNRWRDASDTQPRHKAFKAGEKPVYRPWLDLFQDSWVNNAGGAADLDRRPFVRLAIRRSVADELFGVAPAGDAPPATSEAPKAEQGPSPAPAWPAANDVKGNGALHDYWLLKGGEAGHATAHLAAFYGKGTRCIQQRIAPFHQSARPAPTRAAPGKAQRRKAAAASGAVALSTAWSSPVPSTGAK